MTPQSPINGLLMVWSFTNICQINLSEFRNASNEQILFLLVGRLFIWLAQGFFVKRGESTYFEWIRINYILFVIIIIMSPRKEWADPGGTAIPGQPVEKLKQAPKSSPSTKNQFNIEVPQ